MQESATYQMILITHLTLEQIQTLQAGTVL